MLCSIILPCFPPRGSVSLEFTLATMNLYASFMPAKSGG
jgi:hypothetical protein